MGVGVGQLHWATHVKESWRSGAVARCQKADQAFPRLTAHALRHTAASLAISAGANPKVVQRMPGPAPRRRWMCTPICSTPDLTSVAESVGKMWARNAEWRTCVALHGFSWAPLCWSAVVFVVTQGCWRFAGEMRDAHAVWL